VTTRMPKSKGRPWIALHTTMLTDTDLLMAGNAARLLAPTVLLYCAQQGTDHIPADARRVALFAHLDGGISETVEALEALVRIEFLVEGDLPETYRVRNWARFQADLSGSTTRPESMRRVRYAEAHNAGKHADEVREGCQLCEAATPVRKAAKPAKAKALPVAAEAEGPTAADIRQRVWDRCDKALEIAEADGVDPVEAYIAVYADAVAASTKYADVKGIGEATLPNTVVSHAATTFLSRDGIAPSEGLLRTIHGLRKIHGADVLTKLPAAGQARQPLSYLKGCYKSVEGGAA
jgi:hypothetical protein